MTQIKEWRNEQLEILRQEKPLTQEQQMRYWQEQVVPLFSQTHPKNVLLSFLKEDRLIGYGGLVHIDWEASSSEISFILETKRMETTYEGEFLIFLQLIKEVAASLNILTLTTEVYDFRRRHIELLEESGFRFEKSHNHSIFHTYEIQ